MRTLLRDQNFRLLLAGRTLTMFGDVALFLVLAIWVKDLTGTDGAGGVGVPRLMLPMRSPRSPPCGSTGIPVGA